MSLLHELENLKYYMVLDLIKKDENYDKKRNTLSGEEVFSLCCNRYQLMQKIILPLKEKIGENIEIIDVDFGQGMQEDVSIVIKYLKNDKQHYLSICNLEFGQYEVNTTDSEIDSESFAIMNRYIFNNIFHIIDEYHLDNFIDTKTTSKKLIIQDIGNSFIIKDVDQKMFTISSKHSLYAKSHQLINNLNCNYPKLKELLEDEKNVLNIYRHIHIYEDDIDKVLLKKLT